MTDGFIAISERRKRQKETGIDYSKQLPKGKRRAHVVYRNNEPIHCVTMQQLNI